MNRSVLFLFFIFFNITVFSQEITFYTHVLKPFTCEEDGQIVGLTTEIVYEMMKIVGHKNRGLKLLPFKRMMNLMKKEKRSAAFIVARRPEREDLFKWVGPLATNEVYFYKKNGSKANPKNLEDVKNFKVGVALGNADDTFLTELGFKKLYRGHDQKNNVLQLLSNRVDLTPMGTLVFNQVIEDAGIDPPELVRTDIKLYDSHVYLVFSKDISDEEITLWQNALDEVKRTTYNQIYNKYIN